MNKYLANLIGFCSSVCVSVCPLILLCHLVVSLLVLPWIFGTFDTLCNHSVCVILETSPLCSVCSSYTHIKELHDTPQGSLQVGLDKCLDAVLNHTHDTKLQSESSGQTDTHTEEQNPIQLARYLFTLNWSFI